MLEDISNDSQTSPQASCVVFTNIDFSSLFYDFLRFWLDFGRPRAFQKLKKSEKFDFLSRSVLKEGFGRVLNGFWESFGRILDGF